MKDKILTAALFLLSFTTKAQYDPQLAVPTATGFQIHSTNYVTLPFSITGGLEQPGKWKPNQSAIEGTFYIIYNLNGREGKYGQDMVKKVRAGIDGQWKMEGFALYPPADAYDIEYRFAIFHHLDGKESAGRVYSITPDNKTIKKYGILKLARKPTIIAKPLLKTDFNHSYKKFEKVKLNPQPIPPKTPIKN